MSTHSYALHSVFIHLSVCFLPLPPETLRSNEQIAECFPKRFEIYRFFNLVNDGLEIYNRQTLT